MAASDRWLRGDRLVALIDRLIFAFSKHWLACVNVLAALYVGLPIAAPVLMMLNVGRLGQFINRAYSPLCHQLPHRSWFLFGPKCSYTLLELSELVGRDSLPTGLDLGGFIGNQAVGYKVALCQRDVAIYGAILISGLVFGVFRRWGRVRPLPLLAYFLLGVLPMAFDGGYQWVSYAVALLLPRLSTVPHETTPLLRTVTGALFGWATVWLAYPYLQETMEEFQETLHKRFGWE